VKPQKELWLKKKPGALSRDRPLRTIPNGCQFAFDISNQFMRNWFMKSVELKASWRVLQTADHHQDGTHHTE